MSIYVPHKNFPKVLPLGYMYTRTDEGKIVVPDPKKADLVVLAFRMAGKGKSFRTILKTVTEQGLTSNRGNPLSLSSLHNLLTHPIYTNRHFNSDPLLKDVSFPLISQTLFDQVRRNLKNRRC